MQRATLALVSAALTASCSIPYLRLIRQRRVRPHRTSWFVYSSMAAIAAGAQIQQSADAGAWLAIGSAVGFGAVFVASLWCGVGGRTRFDLLTLMAAAASIALLVAGFPLAATVGVMATEVAATVLTVRKSRVAPSEEAVLPWLIDGLAGLVAIVAVAHFTFTELVYPIHSTAVNVSVIATVLIARRSTDRALVAA